MPVNMVPRTRIREQGLRQPSVFMPLALPDIQYLALHSATRFTDRLIYLTLLIHADAAGNVLGRVTDVAAAAGMETDTARHALARLVRDGHVSRKIPGVGRRLNCWHICAVRDDAA